MLNQIFTARAVPEHCYLQVSRHVELMVARKDDFLDLLLSVPASNEITAEDFQPAFALPHLLPEISSTMTLRIYRVARATIVALVERKEVCSRSFQLRHHVNFAVADDEWTKAPLGNESSVSGA